MRALLRQVGLPAEMHGVIRTSSRAGSGSAVCIARALASEPRVIIADEAVAALDVSIRAQVVNLLMALQARLGIAYLFISHDMAVVERVSTPRRGDVSRADRGDRAAPGGDERSAARLYAAAAGGGAGAGPEQARAFVRTRRQRGALPVAPPDDPPMVAPLVRVGEDISSRGTGLAGFIDRTGTNL